MTRSFDETGLDRSLPHIGVIMEKTDTKSYPSFDLPAGFSFSLYQPGYEEEWASLQYTVGQTDSLEEARGAFFSEFLQTEKDKMCRRMVFVLNPAGKVVGSAVLWAGSHFGREYQRVHWVAVNPEYQGLGISKALVTWVLDLYNALGYDGYIYLTSQTWSYKALNVYSKFGFKPYLGAKPQNWIAGDMTADPFIPWDFETKNREAWKIIGEKIEEYEKRKKEG